MGTSSDKFAAAGIEDVPVIRPINNFKFAVMVFDDGRAIFHPVAAIDVTETVIIMNCRVVNVSADDPIDAVLS